jgi:transposase
MSTSCDPRQGRTVLATLIAEASQPLAERNYDALRTLSGVAPVTKNSGKRSGRRSLVVMRNACSLRLREAMYHWARVAAQRDPKSRRAYAALRARGHSHGRALRTIADRLLSMLCAMLRTRTAYDASKRLAA